MSFSLQVSYLVFDEIELKSNCLTFSLALMSYQPAPCKSVARAERRRRRQHKEVGQRQADLSALTLRLIETDPPFCGQRSLLLLSTLAGESGDLNDTPLSYPCFFAPAAIDHAAKLPASKHNCKLADRNRARRGAQSLLYVRAPCAWCVLVAN